MDILDEVIDYDILGGFDDEEDVDPLELEALKERAEELGLDVEDYDSIEELRDVIESLE